MSTSPTQRSLAHMRAQGYTAAVVEKWNPHAKIRQDLFGFVDVLAVGGAGTVAVQACNYSDVSKRVHKIADSDHITAVRDAGWAVEVHGWRKVGNRWTLRVVDVS